MAYRVLLKRSAEGDIRALPKNVYSRVAARISELGENPRLHGAKKLTSREGWRIRVGDYRIVYVVDDGRKEVHVIGVPHRREAYR